MKRYHLLLAEDDLQLCKMLEEYLVNSGYEVVTAHDGEQALSLFRERLPQLVILDVQMPAVNGIEVCKKIRETADVPIIMATALNTDAERIAGLESGADDYVAKPFHPRELLARIGNLLRRCYGKSLPDGGRDGERLIFDAISRMVLLDGREVKLTPTELKIIELLTGSATRAFNRAGIADHVLGCAYDGCERTIDAHVKRIRSKFKEIAPQTEFIVTVRGYGYRINPKGGAVNDKAE